MLKTFMSVPSVLAQRLRRDDRGATAVEYGLIVFLIALVILGAVTLLGTNLNTVFHTIATDL